MHFIKGSLRLPMSKSLPVNANAFSTARPISQVSLVDPHDPSLALALAAVTAADDRKGVDLILLKVSEIAYLADYFVIVSGYSPVQVKAIARSIEEELADQFQRRPLRREGMGDARWVLQDYGELVIHIFLPDEREFYNLEAFWSHGEVVDWQALLPESVQSHA